MTGKFKILLCAALSSGAILAQSQPATGFNIASLSQEDESPNQNAGAAPVAYVYVTRPTHVDGFATASNGRLTPVPGSPFADISLTHMSVNKNYLFGPDADGENIRSFSIAPDGALTQASVLNAQQYNPGNCGGFGPTALDVTATTIYNIINSECEVEIQSFHIEANGDLQYLGVVDSGLTSDLFSLSNIVVSSKNNFAFQTGCGGDSFPDGGMLEYKRESNGLLTSFGDGIPTPATKNPDDIYCPYLAIASDPSDHFAVVLQPLDDTFSQDGPDAIATYTVGSNGSATTQSTYENMPSDTVDFNDSMSISPTGKLLALAGVNGFQIFHYNGSSPVTKYTGAIQKGDSFIQFCWDSDNHLYALSGNGKLFVYTVTPTSIAEAPGSPYSIPEASSIIALSR